MKATAVTGSPGFISIAVTDVARSAAFYERYLAATRDTFDFGPDAVAFVGWPTFALSSVRQPGQPPPSGAESPIQLWWRASDAQALTGRLTPELMVEAFVFAAVLLVVTRVFFRIGLRRYAGASA